MADDQNSNLAELAAQIVAAYVSRNNIPASDLPGVITLVLGALKTAFLLPEVSEKPAELIPAVPIKKSRD